ncbi:WAT1-related protein At4g08290-like isoform X2 [Rhodamnia argentea]|uniref:WAT1-related protein n=1 Tax=Rhodamnia argentea TaxID=178133 RepID=A0ABM3H1S3_9MYRT|nr:WAT1-related protein At4g08290-like isoform X2 [Rhodamnia argentea]
MHELFALPSFSSPVYKEALPLPLRSHTKFEREREREMGGGSMSVSCGGFNKVKPYLLMVGLQFGTAGMYVISTQTLKNGMSRYVLIVYRNAIAALVLAPFALVLERKIGPKMTFSIFFRIVALGFLEPILDQNFAYLGMMYTSASFASAIMNAVPSVTFVMAVMLRLERAKIKEVRGIAKIVGTIVTFLGALVMTVYKGPMIRLIRSTGTAQSRAGTDPSDQHWVAGTLFILIGCCAWSAFFNLQSAAVALVAERHPAAWRVGWDFRLLAPVYSGVVGSGITYYVQGIVMKTRGPVFVTAFNPLCMIIVAALGSIILSEQLYLGSIIGGIIIAIGLYSVVWGKGKDYPIPLQECADPKDETQKLPVSVANGVAGDHDGTRK